MNATLEKTRTFDTKNVILTRISEDDLQSFLVDSDIDENNNTIFRFPELVEAIIKTVPEYVFAEYCSSPISMTNAVERLKEAAKSIYKIKEYELMKKAYIDNDSSARHELEQLPVNKRGEFGELILHMMLRDFHGTIPLVSKAYFKDSVGVPAHGFDSVHISPIDKILWLGESKFYKNGKKGIKALVDDVKNHFVKDYLNEQITIIKKNLECNSIPQRNEWIETLNSTSKLIDQFKMINIPLLCTYEHDIYDCYSDLDTDEAFTYHETNIRELKTYFDTENTHPCNPRLNIVLLLFPIQDKDKLVKMLHQKLWHMQNI